MTESKPLYSAEQALKLLLKGNERKLAQIARNLENIDTGQKYKEYRERLVKGQNPFAILVSCSDSRFPPEIIFQNREGDLFVVRTAGHVIGNDAAGSIEYAVEHLNAPLIVVMGHDNCGAVTAAVNKSDVPGHIFNVIERIYPAVEKIKNKEGDKVSLAISQHIFDTVEYLKNLEPICKKFYKEGRLKIIGARCPIKTYKAEWFL
jgi:carbonic anhydrase